MRISDWSSDVCSSDLDTPAIAQHAGGPEKRILPSLSCRRSPEHRAAASAKSASVLRCSETQFRKSSRGKSTAKNLRLPCERRGYHAHERPTASRKQQTPSGNRSEERRVGKECVSKCRSRSSPYH